MKKKISFKNNMKSLLKTFGLLIYANRTYMNIKKLNIKIKVLLGVKYIDATYSRSFFRNNIILSDNSSKVLINKLLELHPKINSVIDIGCGNGLYLDKLYKAGIKNLKGIDGSINARKEAIVNKKFIEIFNITKEIPIKEKFDLTMCIEVAEHLESEFANILVKNVTKFSDLIYFTAAPIGQGGTDHVNEQPKEYWIKKFNKEGFEFDEKESIKLKNHLKDKKAVFWLVDNSLIFKRKI